MFNLKYFMCVITARIQRMREGTVFSLFVSPHIDGRGVLHPADGVGGIPILPHRGVPLSFLTGGTRWGVPPPGLDGVPPIGAGWGYPPLGLGGVPPGTGWGTPWLGLDWGTTPIRTGWGTTPVRTEQGYPPPPGATAQALATRRAVCLLRSCRRTFLFIALNCSVARISISANYT